jgi:hypothetical protein
MPPCPSSWSIVYRSRRRSARGEDTPDTAAPPVGRVRIMILRTSERHDREHRTRHGRADVGVPGMGRASPRQPGGVPQIGGQTSGIRPVTCRPPHPSSVPLTDVMEFTAADGTCWSAYVEAIASDTPYRADPPLLPTRHLRFDSDAESRTVTPVPAGAPFLTESRLRTLLDHATPFQPIPAPELRIRRDRRTGGAASDAVQIGRAMTAGTRERWRRGAAERSAVRSRVEGRVVLAADRIIAWVAGLLSRWPRARL